MRNNMGAPALNSGGTAFGQAATPGGPGLSGFGQPSSIGAGAGFGQPSAFGMATQGTGGANAFGSFGGSGGATFGQASSPGQAATGFGQSSHLQTAGGFGSSVGGAQLTTQGTSPFGGTQTGNAFQSMAGGAAFGGGTAAPFGGGVASPFGGGGSGGFSSLAASGGGGAFGASNNFGSSLSIPQPQSGGGSQWQMRK